jgi:hypothetical protein
LKLDFILKYGEIFEGGKLCLFLYFPGTSGNSRYVASYQCQLHTKKGLEILCYKFIHRNNMITVGALGGVWNRAAEGCLVTRKDVTRTMAERKKQKERL